MSDPTQDPVDQNTQTPATEAPPDAPAATPPLGKPETATPSPRSETSDEHQDAPPASSVDQAAPQSAPIAAEPEPTAAAQSASTASVPALTPAPTVGAAIEATPAPAALAAAAEPAAIKAANASGGQTPAPAAEKAPEPAPARVEKQPAPKPRPAPRPGPRPGPRPAPAHAGAPSPAQPQATPEPAPVLDEAAAKKAAEFGTVDEDGTVHVRTSAGDRVVGQFPGVSKEEALSLYVRRYLDLVGKVDLFEQRLDATDLSAKEIDSTLARLTADAKEPPAVGDLDGLRARVAALGEIAAQRRAAVEAERVAAKEAALEARTKIIEAAERIAATDPEKMQWRPAGEELRTLLGQWKSAQRSGPRIDRSSEEALWKRFSHARTTFDRQRRHFFADLEQRNNAAKAAKEELVAEAEALSVSTEWGPTAGAFRDLMVRWKAAGRAARRDDDALWARFRAAQDAFFGARDAANAATDAEYAANLEVKEALLAEAEALLPVTDLGAAKAALRTIQDRWEEAGRVPRGDLQRVEGRLRAVESAIRDADEARWKRTNPETQARAEGAAAQLESAIAGLESELADARAAGNARKVDELEQALAARRSWLEQVLKAAADSRG